jgi:hypothetical protein
MRMTPDCALAQTLLQVCVSPVPIDGHAHYLNTLTSDSSLSYISCRPHKRKQNRANREFASDRGVGTHTTGIR